MRKIKLAIVDDQKLFLKGLRYIVSSFSNVDLIIEAENGKELIEAVPDNPPDVILMDLKMPEMDGLETTKYIKAHFPKIKIILLTMFDDEHLITLMMDHGANGYLVKNEDPQVLREAIEAVAERDYYFNDYVSKALLKGLKTKRSGSVTPPGLGAVDPSFQLTPRELEVLELICREHTTSEIAEKLFIASRTVEGHRRNLLEKTGARNAAGLVIFAFRHGLVQV